jgi:lipopolysaccharide/colanic/teichoic acid biosynthesis glycosyltransferase
LFANYGKTKYGTPHWNWESVSGSKRHDQALYWVRAAGFCRWLVKDECERMTIHLKDFPETGAGLSVAPVQNGAVRPRKGFYKTYGKRAIDIALILFAAPFVLPVVAVIALMATSKGASPFYFQRRIGKGGTIFNLVKIRTMVPNAEAALETYLASDPAARQEWDTTQKLKHDPRITKAGHFLRKSSLDELPQLWNVLKGDMSLIGPRPMMVDQQQLYPGTAYYALRPGISGAWQVSDRNDSSFADRAGFDTDYNNSLSFKTDFSILVRTFGAVVRCTGY